MKEIAARVGINPAWLSRAFKSSYGESTADYMWRLRVEHAARRIAGTTGRFRREVRTLNW